MASVKPLGGSFVYSQYTHGGCKIKDETGRASWKKEKLSREYQIFIDALSLVLPINQGHLAFELSGCEEVTLIETWDNILRLHVKWKKESGSLTLYIERENRNGPCYIAYPYLAHPLTLQEATIKCDKLHSLLPDFICEMAFYNSAGIIGYGKNNNETVAYYIYPGEDKYIRIFLNQEGDVLFLTDKSKMYFHFTYSYATGTAFLNNETAHAIPVELQKRQSVVAPNTEQKE